LPGGSESNEDSEPIAETSALGGGASGSAAGASARRRLRQRAAEQRFIIEPHRAGAQQLVAIGRRQAELAREVEHHLGGEIAPRHRRIFAQHVVARDGFDARRVALDQDVLVRDDEFAGVDAEQRERVPIEPRQQVQLVEPRRIFAPDRHRRRHPRILEIGRRRVRGLVGARQRQQLRLALGLGDRLLGFGFPLARMAHRRLVVRIAFGRPIVIAFRETVQPARRAQVHKTK
jgi:hypothetical protein